MSDNDAPTQAEPFGPVIYAYSRAQAIADGFQIDVTKTAQEAGIRFPVFLTRAVYDAYVTVPPDVAGQDEAGRLWDLVTMTRFAILRARPGCNRLPVALYVRNDNRRPRLVRLTAACGPLDIEDPRPTTWGLVLSLGLAPAQARARGHGLWTPVFSGLYASPGPRQPRHIGVGIRPCPPTPMLAPSTHPRGYAFAPLHCALHTTAPGACASRLVSAAWRI